MKTIKRSSILLGCCCLVYIGLLLFPSILFSHEARFEQFHIYSDRPIPTEIEAILQDVKRRISASALYQEDARFTIYFSNDDWRFTFFTRNPMAGGVVNFLFTADIFIRESVIEENRIVPPGDWLFEANERTLSYFIAHEAVHSMQSRLDRYLIFKAPHYILEGYADYIAKVNANSYTSLCADFLANAPEMDPKNGLYNQYHLYMAYWLDKRGYDFFRMLKEQPDLESTMTILQEACLEEAR